MPNKNLKNQNDAKELDEIKKKLKGRKFLEQSIVALYLCQTAKERESGFTIFRNRRGFNRADSYRLSEMGLLLIKGGHLTEKEIIFARKKMIKYAKQLKAEGVLDFNKSCE